MPPAVNVGKWGWFPVAVYMCLAVPGAFLIEVFVPGARSLYVVSASLIAIFYMNGLSWAVLVYKRFSEPVPLWEKDGTNLEEAPLTAVYTPTEMPCPGLMAALAGIAAFLLSPILVPIGLGWFVRGPKRHTCCGDMAYVLVTLLGWTCSAIGIVYILSWGCIVQNPHRPCTGSIALPSGFTVLRNDTDSSRYLIKDKDGYLYQEIIEKSQTGCIGPPLQYIPHTLHYLDGEQKLALKAFQRRQWLAVKEGRPAQQWDIVNCKDEIINTVSLIRNISAYSKTSMLASQRWDVYSPHGSIEATSRLVKGKGLIDELHLFSVKGDQTHSTGLLLGTWRVEGEKENEPKVITNVYHYGSLIPDVIYAMVGALIQREGGSQMSMHRHAP